MQWQLLFAIPLALLAACKPVPEIGRNLPSNYAQANAVFDKRVRTRFPVGTDETRLSEELNRQGFDLLPHHLDDGVRDATFIKSEGPFETIWSVRWRVSNSKVSEIWGVHGARTP